MAEEMLISAEESVMANFDFLSREGRFLMPYFSNIFSRKKNYTLWEKTSDVPVLRTYELLTFFVHIFEKKASFKNKNEVKEIKKSTKYSIFYIIHSLIYLKCGQLNKL